MMAAFRTSSEFMRHARSFRICLIAKVGKVLFVLIGFTLAVSGCARHSDQEWLLREFALPQDVELTVNSSPEDESHWADRKNLKMNATFKFSPTQFLDYSRTVETKPADWHVLPFSNDLKQTLTQRLNDSPLAKSAIRKAAHGFYLLKTADGNNFLKSANRMEWNPNHSDFELAILNADSAELKIFVRQ